MTFAYIDPGAGSMLIQAALAAALAIPFFFRSVLARGLTRIRRNGRDQRGPDTP